MRLHSSTLRSTNNFQLPPTFKELIQSEAFVVCAKTFLLVFHLLLLLLSSNESLHLPLKGVNETLKVASKAKPDEGKGWRCWDGSSEHKFMESIFFRRCFRGRGESKVLSARKRQRKDEKKDEIMIT